MYSLIRGSFSDYDYLEDILVLVLLLEIDFFGES
jgi:hypothetical protein